MFLRHKLVYDYELYHVPIHFSSFQHFLSPTPILPSIYEKALLWLDFFDALKRGYAALFLLCVQIIIRRALSSMPISILASPGAYSPSSVQGMLPSLSAVTWRTWRKMSALLFSYSS